MKRQYSDDFIANALAEVELAGGNVKGTARKLGLPQHTLRNWTLEPRSPLGMQPKNGLKHNFVNLWDTIQSLTLEKIQELVPNATVADLRTLYIGAGIAADKHMDYSLGRKGTEVTVNNIVPVQVVIQSQENI